VASLAGHGYLSPVRRIDQAYGDRNLVCSCPSPEAFAEPDPAEIAADLAGGNGVSRPAGAPDDLGTTADVVAAGR
jgi:glycine dehydrogenase